MIEHHFYVLLGGFHYNILILEDGKIFIDRHELTCKNNGCDVINIRRDPWHTEICKLFAEWRNS